MPLVTVRFTRVFDKVDNPSRRDNDTLFGFDSDIGAQYGVRVPGRPAIWPGMRVLAYLDKADRWDTLVGWRNLDTGELAIDNGLIHWIFLFGTVLMLIAAIGGSAQPWWIYLAICMTLLGNLSRLLKIHRVRRALQTAAPGLTQDGEV